ncbi:hypothetical protein BCV71DRAFT_190580, partial [Rhizopus microsporus]
AKFTEKHIMSSIRRVLLKDACQGHYYAMIDKPGKSCKKPNFMIDTLMGFRCTLFRMKLLEDGVYMSVAIDRFFRLKDLTYLRLSRYFILSRY